MSTKPKRGRPKATDKPDVVSLLVAAFRDGMTVRQACIQSGISHEAYYQRKRRDAAFADKMYYAQQSATIAAKRNVIKAIEGGDVKTSQWWLERVRFSEEDTEEPTIEARAVEPMADPMTVLASIDDYKRRQAAALGMAIDKV